MRANPSTIIANKLWSEQTKSKRPRPHLLWQHASQKMANRTIEIAETKSKLELLHHSNQNCAETFFNVKSLSFSEGTLLGSGNTALDKEQDTLSCLPLWWLHRWSRGVMQMSWYMTVASKANIMVLGVRLVRLYTCSFLCWLNDLVTVKVKSGTGVTTTSFQKWFSCKRWEWVKGFWQLW